MARTLRDKKGKAAAGVAADDPPLESRADYPDAGAQPGIGLTEVSTVAPGPAMAGGTATVAEDSATLFPPAAAALSATELETDGVDGLEGAGRRRLQGYIDEANANRVTGWMWDPQQHDSPIGLVSVSFVFITVFITV